MPSLQPTELTVRAIFLVIVLAVILAAANAYLALKVGMTVSASIPAAVISMGILSFFKNSSILENNIVQTGASAGEAVTAGIAFLLPALIILHYWQHFDYWQTFFITITGGILGVLFSIPLRRVLLADKTLRFPEGTAIGQVLKVSQGAGHLKELVRGGLLGAIVALFQGGFQIIANNLMVWLKVENKFIYGFGFGFDPALLAAGYIIGIEVALSTLVGVVIGWGFGVPIFSYLHPLANHGDVNDAVMNIWQSNIRPIGIGTMLVGGFWTLITLIKPIVKGVHSSFISLQTAKKTGFASLPKHERDIPINYTIAFIGLLLIPLGFILFDFISSPTLGLGLHLQIITLIIGVIFILVIGFFFSSLNGYFAGLVGSSNCPISGISISVILLASLMLIGLFYAIPGFTSNTQHLLEAEGLVIIICALVAASCAITGDTIQDLKTGEIVGATPWKQQIILILGVIVSALALAPTLDLLFNAYGMGGISPPGHHVDPSKTLLTPQATLMATLVTGAFHHNLPWGLISIGFAVAIGCILVDRFLQPRGMRLPVLAVGLGIYFSIDVSVALILGGFASYLAERNLGKQHLNQNEESADNPARQRGLTLACGVVAGACLMGVVLAIPFTLAQSTDVLRLMPTNLTLLASIFGILSTLGILGWIYKTVCQKVH